MRVGEATGRSGRASPGALGPPPRRARGRGRPRSLPDRSRLPPGDAAPWPFWMDLGAPNLGGAIATAGGLVFVAATLDKFIRAFDARTGDEVWTQRLPFTGNATPMTYRLREGSRQYLVIAAGGHGWSEPGDALLAFALPE